MTLNEDDLLRMQQLAQVVHGLRPEFVNNDATYGELAWVWGMDGAAAASSWRHRLWTEGEREQVAGWGWIHLPRPIRRSDGSTSQSTKAYLAWLVHPDRPELLDEILDWYDESAAGLIRTVGVRDANTDAVSRLAAHGYAVDEQAAGDDGYWVQLNTRELDDIEEPVLPTGYRFRTAADVSTEEVWKAHVAAWHPSTLTLEGMRGTQATASYRADLHVLVEAPDGTLVASATMWLDPVNATAEFEPVGTHAAYRRLGLGRALLLYGMRLARAAGARRMLVACLGAPAHQAARGLYYSVGFQPITRDVPHVKSGVE